MTSDLLKYNQKVEDALRTVIRATLSEVADNGLPPHHQLYITFLTSYPSVEVSDHLQDQYQNEMTIVLEHQFWGLEVKEYGFFVSLSFNDIQERLYVPYKAILSFVDPSVNFALQFQSDQAKEETGESAREPKLISTNNKTLESNEMTAEESSKKQKVIQNGHDDITEEKVVTLDAFRNK